MKYRHLGRLGLKVSPLCLGTMNFGPQTSEPDSHAIMDRALELGIGGSRKPEALKCLHAHVAFALARPGYRVGEAILDGTIRPATGRVVVTHLGVGLADVVFADAIVQRAVSMGLGTALPR